MNETAKESHENGRIVFWFSTVSLFSVTIGRIARWIFAQAVIVQAFPERGKSCPVAEHFGVPEMRRVVNACIAASCIALFAGLAQTAHAQFGGAAVGFRNELRTPIIVQGLTVVNGMQKRGQAIVILPGKAGFDYNVPVGPRFYIVCDANQPNLVWLRNVPIAVMGQDINFAIRGVAPKVFIQPVP
jgi:hypothetical protein